jgi:hypothetical protein
MSYFSLRRSASETANRSVYMVGRRAHGREPGGVVSYVMLVTTSQLVFRDIYDL